MFRFLFAVKLLLPGQVPNIEDWASRWRSQAEILRSLDHPNLVKVREVFKGPVAHQQGAADPASIGLYLVMNWVEGANLEHWVESNPERSLVDSANVVVALAGAVDYLHSGTATGSPVIHRDIKPANVLIDSAGDVKLVDFGVAHLDSRPSMTVVGTPSFISPEVVSGAPATGASDRFSLGALAYFLLVGAVPMAGDYVGIARPHHGRARPGRPSGLRRPRAVDDEPEPVSAARRRKRLGPDVPRGRW